MARIGRDDEKENNLFFRNENGNGNEFVQCRNPFPKKYRDFRGLCNGTA